MNDTAVKPVSEKNIRFIKEIRDYLYHSGLTDYDYSRIMEIFEKHNSQNIVYYDRIIERPVEVSSLLTYVCSRCATRKTKKTRTVYYHIDDIESVVCSFMNLNPDEIRQKNRKTERVLTRAFIYHFAVKHTVMSMKSIGKKYGGRDHTTVIAGLKRLKDRIDTEPAIQSCLSEIAELLKPYAIKKR